MTDQVTKGACSLENKRGLIVMDMRVPVQRRSIYAHVCSVRKRSRKLKAGFRILILSSLGKQDWFICPYCTDKRWGFKPTLLLLCVVFGVLSCIVLQCGDVLYCTVLHYVVLCCIECMRI